MTDEPPTVQQGTTGMELYELYPGVKGYAIEHNNKIYIPIIMGSGSGQVGKFLDECSQRCVIASVTSVQLVTMLLRRGFVRTTEIAEHDGEEFDVWVRGVVK